MQIVTWGPGWIEKQKRQNRANNLGNREDCENKCSSED